MENTSKPVENVKEVNEFQKILNEDELLKKLDGLTQKTNAQIAIAIAKLAKGEAENPEELLKDIDEARRLVVTSIGWHHDIVMARYAKYVGDESETSAAKVRYW
jgi:hypothetical protein